MNDLGEISELMRRVNKAEPGAHDALFAAADSELRKLARSSPHDGGPNTVLDTAAPVHESSPGYLKVVDGRCFGGYAEQEIAEAPNLTERTVRREFDKARLLLGAMLKAQGR